MDGYNYYNYSSLFEGEEAVDGVKSLPGVSGGPGPGWPSASFRGALKVSSTLTPVWVALQMRRSRNREVLNISPPHP